MAYSFASQYDFVLEGYTTQAAFLLSLDLLIFAAEKEALLSETEKFALHQAIKILTLPTEMGELIKVMALSKNLDKPADFKLQGFTLQDRRRDL